MAFNIFGKIYTSPHYLYDNSYNRVVFAKNISDVEYLTYEVMEREGYETSVLLVTDSVDDILPEYGSIANYLKHLYDSGWDGRIYADQASYMKLFFAWLKIAFPNTDNDISFTIYNIIKQREELVFPDNKDSIGFLVPRLATKSTNTVLNKADFLTELAAFNDSDPATVDDYDSIRNAVRNDLPVEFQLASYLSGAVDISTVVDKIKRIGSKNAFNIIGDIRDYIRENIMTERVRAMTNISLSWDDQNWESTLRSQSPEMNFLFSSDEDSIRESYTYRMNNIETVFYWIQWLIDNTTEEDKNDIELYDLVKSAQYAIQWKDMISPDIAVVNQKAQDIIDSDVNFSGSTIFFQTEHLREKINTFLIEYIYQLKLVNDTETLNKLSHT